MIVVIQDVAYPVTIFYRAKRRMILRYKEDGFQVLVPKRTSEDWIEKQILLHGKKLLEKIKKIPQPFNDKGMYLCGAWEHYPIQFKGFIIQKPHPQVKANPYSMELRVSFTEAIGERVQWWQHRLKIKTSYRIRVRIMTTRLGSNSRKTHTLTFAMKLIHFAWPIIDAVIVHELIHDTHFDHSKNFYSALYQAYPTYEQEHAKILKGQYQ